MNRQEIEIMIAALMFLLGIAVIIYDRIRHRKYYEQKGKFLFLRINNPDVRKQIREAGITLCPCARDFGKIYLYTADGSIVCGFSENHQHLIADAAKNHQQMIDCGVNVDKFIQEVKNYDRAE